jgi:hypothetical protein
MIRSLGLKAKAALGKLEQVTLPPGQRLAEGFSATHMTQARFITRGAGRRPSAVMILAGEPVSLPETKATGCLIPSPP